GGSRPPAREREGRRRGGAHRPPARRTNVAPRRLHARGRADHGRRRPHAARGVTGDARRRRGARPRPRPFAEPLSPRDPEPLRPLAAGAGAPPRQLHVPEEAVPHRRQPGPAPPHGPRLASADDPHRHAAARLRPAPARRGQPGGACSLRRGDGPRLGRQEPAARVGRPAGEGPLPPPEREGAPVPRDGEPPLPRPQMGDAHLLQRPGGDLPGLDGGARAGPRAPSAARAPHGAAVRAARGTGDAHLHRGRAFLRRARLAQLPERRAADLTGASPTLSGWGRVPSPGPEVPSGDLEALPRDAILCRGLGRSYGDSSLPPREHPVVAATPLADRILSFDPETGALRAEAGLSALEIVRTFLPRGFFLPVTPGTQYVTLGGMVAAD